MIRNAIVELSAKRGIRKSICPSEVARLLAGDWRPLMPLVRKAGIELASLDKISVLQNGQVVDAASAKGPIRYRIKE
ncbi:MAG: DUF3253 domain-containing protein [Planctomycetota bacterium]